MNYVTEEGMKKNQEQLRILKFEKRAEVTERLNAARKHGDLRENGDYKAAREELSQLDSKIQELENFINNSQIIDESEIDISTVKIFTTVQLRDHTRNRDVEYKIVSQSEADPIERKISADSPIGKGLLGKKVGDFAEIEVPAGILKFEVIKILK